MIIFYRDNKIVYSRFEAPEGVISAECSLELEAILNVAQMTGWDVDLGDKYVGVGVEQIKRLFHSEHGFEILIDPNASTVKGTSGLFDGCEISKHELTPSMIILQMLTAYSSLKLLEVIVNQTANDCGIEPSQILKAIPNICTASPEDMQKAMLELMSLV